MRPLTGSQSLPVNMTFRLAALVQQWKARELCSLRQMRANEVS